MANEITASASLNFTYSGQTTSITVSSASTTPSEVEVISGIQSVGTSDETISLGDLAAPGWIMLKNLDTTNYVELGPDGTNWDIKIPAGKSAGPMLWNVAAVHVKANTSPCMVSYVITGR